jgi:hypothetical protein
VGGGGTQGHASVARRTALKRAWCGCCCWSTSQPTAGLRACARCPPCMGSQSHHARARMQHTCDSSCSSNSSSEGQPHAMSLSDRELPFLSTPLSTCALQACVHAPVPGAGFCRGRRAWPQHTTQTRMSCMRAPCCALKQTPHVCAVQRQCEQRCHGIALSVVQVHAAPVGCGEGDSRSVDTRTRCCAVTRSALARWRCQCGHQSLLMLFLGSLKPHAAQAASCWPGGSDESATCACVRVRLGDRQLRCRLNCGVPAPLAATSAPITTSRPP